MAFYRKIEPEVYQVGGRRYIQIRNSETQEDVMIDVELARYRRIAMGFLNKLKLSPCFNKHIVLTQAVESYKPGLLNPFFSAMRKHYGDLDYIWTVEIQEERAEKYGDRVLHWHIIMSFDWDIDFGKDDVLRIQRYWKYGQVEVIPVKKPNLGYLMKYITKSLESPLNSEYQIKKISSSRIAGYLKQSWKKICAVIEDFRQFFLTIDQFIDFKWSRKGCYIEDNEDISIKISASGRVRRSKGRIYIHTFPSSPWYKVGEFIGEPV